ncbi:MAG TPA: hypothetical protein VGH33_18410, partial [Isosphaeraceae bacterium]
MSKLSEPLYRDETLPEEIVAYKPFSPAAMLGLSAGIVSVLAALAVWDIGWGFLAAPIVGLFFGWKGLGSVRHYDMAGRSAAKMALVLSAMSIVVGSAAYAYLLKTAVPPGYEIISYDPLQPDIGGPISKKAQELEGKKVYIKGYMYPTNYGKTRFVLCRDNGTCCFGGQPKLNDMVEVKTKEGLGIDYTSSLHGIG